MDTDQGNLVIHLYLQKFNNLHLCILSALKHVKLYPEVPELNART
jgi:hypothetical protein